MTEEATEASRLVGATLGGRYRLTRLIGEGGMGAVYAATNLEGTATCAVKVLSRELAGDPNVTSRFFTEAEASQRLDHPGIVRIYEGAAAEDGTPYLAMELLEGHPLADRLVARAPVPIPEAAAIVCAVLDAIGYAHARGVVHRDLKPENLFVLPSDPRTPHIKVLDFGLAKVLDAAGGNMRTSTGMLLGTPGYMSPEQIADARAVDPRSDLFSLGVMLFEMLTGADPYPANNGFEKLTKMLTSEAPSITMVAPHLAPFENFFLRALAREPANRFSTAAEMSQALRALSGLPLQLVSPSTAPPALRNEQITQLSRGSAPSIREGKPEIAPGQVQVVKPSGSNRRALLVAAAIVGAILLLASGIGLGLLLAQG